MLTASPVQATTTWWSANLTVEKRGPTYHTSEDGRTIAVPADRFPGCAVERCGDRLTDGDFDYWSNIYTIETIKWNPGNKRLYTCCSRETAILRQLWRTGR